MVAQMGGAYQMRGYYEGQYQDKNLIQTQIERASTSTTGMELPCGEVREIYSRISNISNGTKPSRLTDSVTAGNLRKG